MSNTRKQKLKPVLGIDIGTYSIKVLELRKASGGYKAVHYGIELIAEGAVSSKLVNNVELVGDALRTAYKRSGSSLKDAALAISGPTFVTKVLQIPNDLSAIEQEEQIHNLVGREISYPIDEVTWDFDLLGPSEDDPDNLDVLLVAGRQDNINDLEAVLDYAGLKGYIIDSAFLALQNACRLLSDVSDANQTILIVDFGLRTTSFSIFNNLGRLLYTSDHGFGGKQLTDEIMHHYQMSEQDAEQAKLERKLPDNYNADVLRPFMNDMAQEVNRALQYYYASTSNHVSVDQVILCGGIAAISGVAEVVSGIVGIPTSAANPFAHRLSFASSNKFKNIDKYGTSLMVAAGLALRSFE